jgi:hypothetical protein
MLLVIASALIVYADVDPLLHLYAVVCTAVLFVVNWAVIAEDLVAASETQEG